MWLASAGAGSVVSLDPSTNAAGPLAPQGWLQRAPAPALPQSRHSDLRQPPKIAGRQVRLQRHYQATSALLKQASDSQVAPIPY